MLRWITLLGACLLLLLSCVPPSQAQAPERRRTVGLALGGGSALGIAHAGVLQWLEEHRIPVDYIAGTSIGGLVGSAYATGMTAAEIGRLLEKQDWNSTLAAESGYTNLTYRRKEDRRDYPSDIRLSLSKVGQAASGINPVPRVALFLSRIGARVGILSDFDQLPIPFRCVAVDLRSGDTVTLSRGDLATALRATMALPGLFPPMDREGLLLIDGGVANNVPADIARSMGADMVIAVKVEDGFARQEQFGGLIDILGRTLSVLTNKSNQKGIAAADLVLHPDLKPYTVLDWMAAPELIKRGWAEAEANKEKLLPLALSEEQWQAHLATRRARLPRGSFVPQFFEVTGTSSTRQAQALQHYLTPLAGHPLDPDALENALSLASGNSFFASLTYVPVQKNGRVGIRVIAQDNPSAPPSFVLAPIISSNQPRTVTTRLTGRVTLSDQVIRNSETRLDFGVGSSQYYAAEYFLPSTGLSAMKRARAFVAPRIYYHDTPQSLFVQGTRTADYLVRTSAAGMDFGFIEGRTHELRFGWEQGHLGANVLVGALESPSLTGSTRQFHVRYTYDGQDAPVLPRNGLRASGNFERIYRAPGAVSSYDRVEVASSWFTPRSAKDTLFLGASAGAVLGSSDSPLSEFSLGGLMRLSAYEPSEFVGRRYYFASAGYLRQVNAGNFLFGGRTSLGAWLELGDVSGSQVARTRSAYPFCLSTGLVIETALGPVVAGASLGHGGETRAFFSVGRFLY